MTKPKKRLHELETHEVMRHVFHKEAFKHLKDVARAEKPKSPRSRSIQKKG